MDLVLALKIRPKRFTSIPRSPLAYKRPALGQSDRVVHAEDRVVSVISRVVRIRHFRSLHFSCFHQQTTKLLQRQRNTRTRALTMKFSLALALLASTMAAVAMALPVDDDHDDHMTTMTAEQITAIINDACTGASTAEACSSAHALCMFDAATNQCTVGTDMNAAKQNAKQFCGSKTDEAACMTYGMLVNDHLCDWEMENGAAVCQADD